MLRIKLVRGIYGQKPRNEATLKALGFTKTGQVVFHEDNAVIQGMIQHVRYALEISEVTKEEAAAAKQTRKPGITVSAPAATPAKAAKATKPAAPKKATEAPAADETKAKKTTKKKSEESAS